MTSTILFNGVDLSEYIRPLWTVDEQIVPKYDDDHIPVGNSDGEFFRGRVISPRTITIPYYMIEPTQQRREKFASLLNVDEPKQLIFFDRPNECYLAIPEGGVNVGKTGWNDKSTLTFTCYDPFRHSLESTTATPDSTGQITIDYKGTYPTYPIITATMKSENGLVGFANDKGGVLQFGNPEEVDTVTLTKSDKVINYGMRAGQTGLTQNVGPGTYTTYIGNKLSNKMQGSVTFDGENANPHYTNDNGIYWHGPTLHGAIPANSNGDNTGAFIWKNRFDFNTDVTSLGRLEFTLTSGDKPVLTYTMRDSVENANQVVSQFGGAGLDQSVEMNPKLFGNGFYEIAISRDNNGGLFTLSKVKFLNGDIVVAGSTYKKAFNNDTFQTMPIDGMTVWFQKFSNKKAVNMDWTDSKFTWVNVPYIEDVPNRFDTGDVVTVDVANRKIYVNDVLDNTLQTVGNQWESFALQPGTTTIQPVASSWATMYDCKLTYREAWI